MIHLADPGYILEINKQSNNYSMNSLSDLGLILYPKNYLSTHQPTNKSFKNQSINKPIKYQSINHLEDKTRGEYTRLLNNEWSLYSILRLKKPERITTNFTHQPFIYTQFSILEEGMKPQPKIHFGSSKI